MVSCRSRAIIRVERTGDGVRHQRWIGVLIAAMFFLIAAPVRAADMCDQYPDRFAPVEIDWIHDRLKRMAPARYVELVQRIEIVTVVADEEHIAPSVTGGAGGQSYRVEIPDGFGPFQCRMILLQMYYAGGVLPDGSMPRAVMNLCLDRTGDDWTCVFKAAQWILAPAKEALDLDFGKERIFELTQSAIVGYLLHEFSHIVDQEEKRSREGEEHRADAFANLSMILFGQDDIALFSVFTALDLLDGRIGPGEHGSFLCRAKIAAAGALALKDRTRVLMTWSMDDALYRTTPLERPDKPFQIPSGPLQADAIKTAHCPGERMNDVRMIAADLDAMLAALDATAGNTDPLAFYQPLTRLTLKAPESRYIRGRIVAHRFFKIYVRIGDDIEAKKKFLKVATDYLDHPDVKAVSSEDYGKVFGSVSDARFAVEFLPRDSVPRAELTLLRDDLRRALYFSNRSLMSFITLLRIELLLGDCPAADQLVALSAKYPGKEIERWQPLIEKFRSEWTEELGCDGSAWVTS